MELGWEWLRDEKWVKLPVLVAVPTADGETPELLAAVGSWPFHVRNNNVVVVARVALQRTACLCIGPRGVNIATSQLGVYQDTGIKKCSYLM